jgi:hypothetical protein
VSPYKSPLVPQRGITLHQMRMSLASGNELCTPCSDQSHTLFVFSDAHHAFIQPNNPSIEETNQSFPLNNHIYQRIRFKVTGAYQGSDQAPLPSSHRWAYFDGTGSYLFQMGCAPNFPGSYFLYQGSIAVYRPEASVSKGGLSKCLD